jgi:DNA-binding NarL/FixJ family response regulator
VNSTGDRKLYKPFVGIALLAESRREAATLVRVVRTTPLARVIFFSHILPQKMLASSVINEIQRSPSRIALVVVGTKDPQPAIDAISLLCERAAGISVVAYGGDASPKTVVALMHAGARDFIEQTASPKELNALIVRLLGTDDPDTGRSFPPPDSGPPDGSLPPTVLVGVPRPRAPRTLPSRMATPDE